MSKVYFLKDFKKLSIKAKKLLRSFYSTNFKVLVKIHFGEPGNKFTFTPGEIKPIVEAMEFLKLNPVFIDTPVAYSSPRSSIKGYKKVVKEKGYDKLAPFIISNNAIKIKTKDFTAEVCKELVEAENILVISQCQGCGICANFCPVEVIKIVDGKARIDLDNCLGCSICQIECPYKCLAPKKAYFDDLLY